MAGVEMDIYVQNLTSDSDNEANASAVALKYAQDRNGAWWYSAFHNVTAIVGAGVLALPSSMAYFGWEAGPVILFMAGATSIYTMWQLVQMHEMDGKRYDTYYALGRKAYGTWGERTIFVQQTIVQVGADIVYSYTGGQCLWLFYQLVISCPHRYNPVAIGAEDICCGNVGPAGFIILFAVVQLVLSQWASFRRSPSAYISLVATVLSVCYCTIAFIDSLIQGRIAHSRSPHSPTCPTDYKFPHKSNVTGADGVFGVFRAFGVVAFAYAGHSVALEIQSSLPSIPSFPATPPDLPTAPIPSAVPMWKGVKVAYIIVILSYFAVPIAGYWAFGSYLAFLGTSSANPSGGNILLQMGRPTWLIATANFMVFVHVFGGYQVYAIPVFDTTEKFLVARFRLQHLPRYRMMLRLVTRSAYVLFTGFMAMTFPYFTDLLAFFGGIAFTPLTYFVPCVLWLKLKKTHFALNMAIIVFGVALTLVSMVGGMRDIIKHRSQKYQSYQFYCRQADVTMPGNVCGYVGFHYAQVRT